jgi:hypothetical protein
MVVDAEGRDIIDAKNGKPFVDDVHRLLGQHLLRYDTIPLSRHSKD